MAIKKSKWAGKKFNWTRSRSRVSGFKRHVAWTDEDRAKFLADKAAREKPTTFAEMSPEKRAEM